MEMKYYYNTVLERVLNNVFQWVNWDLQGSLKAISKGNEKGTKKTITKLNKNKPTSTSNNKK